MADRDSKGCVDRVFGFLRVHVIAYVCFILAFFAWKDYLGKPHRRVAVESLAWTTGPVGQFSGMVSLPSGFQSGNWMMLENPRRDFDVALGIDRDAKEKLSKGAVVTVGYSPEEDPAKATAQAFSLKLGDRELLDPDIQVRGYNAALDKKLRFAIWTTAGGVVALVVVELVRRRLFKRA